MKNALGIVVFTLVAACDPTPGTPPTPPGPIADAGISLSETVCFGTCPAYTVTVFPNEFYQLELGRFTRDPGTTETGVFPAGTFAAANAALNTADFRNLPTDITIGSADCGPTVISDLPRVQISEVTIAGARVIDYYPGCLDAAAGPALTQLLTDLRTAFTIPAIVEP